LLKFVRILWQLTGRHRPLGSCHGV